VRRGRNVNDIYLVGGARTGTGIIKKDQRGEKPKSHNLPKEAEMGPGLE